MSSNILSYDKKIPRHILCYHVNVYNDPKYLYSNLLCTMFLIITRVVPFKQRKNTLEMKSIRNVHDKLLKEMDIRSNSTLKANHEVLVAQDNITKQ